MIFGKYRAGRAAMPWGLALALFVVLVVAPGRASQQGGAGAQGILDPNAPLAVFDANREFTAGVFLPVSNPAPRNLAVLTTPGWSEKARPVDHVAADGASLLLVRVLAPRGGTVLMRVSSTDGTTDPGSLWQVNDPRLVDATAQGGRIDNQPPGPPQLAVRTVGINGRQWAFALYRSPRNFDSGDQVLDQNGRGVELRTVAPGGSQLTQTLTVVRPLVVLLHGTGGDTGSWDDFPLYQQSATELEDFEFQPGDLPFQVDRISYQWIDISTGPLVQNGQTVVPQINRSLEDWREITGWAGTQVDLITHSFGGPIARQAAQTQADRNPLTFDEMRNFRAATNWGHGTMHKLLTLAGSFRGTGGANAISYINHFGKNGSGALRDLGCSLGLDIAAGAIRDQMVASPAMLALDQTRVPAHAFVGSGTLVNSISQGLAYFFEYAELQSNDVPNGPYTLAGNINEDQTPCSANRLTNFVFNLDYNTPPLTPSPECTVIPNYDLTVPAYGSQAFMPDVATTTAADLSPSLVGKLDHSELLTNALVSNHVVQLLQTPTTNSQFAYFPDAQSVPLTPLEQEFQTRQFGGEQMFSAAYLEEGMGCTGPPSQSSLFSCPNWSSVTVEPSELDFRGLVPEPLFVYGDNAGTLTNVQSLDSRTWCEVTIESSDPGVVTVQADPITGTSVIVPQSFGTATLTVTVQNAPAPVQIPVTVEGAEVEATLVTPILVSASNQPANFAFLSNATFDARRLLPPTIRIGGIPPLPFGGDQIVRFADVNGDGRVDAVIRVRPRDLNLPRGQVSIPLQAAAAVLSPSGLVPTLVQGTAFAIAR